MPPRKTTITVKTEPLEVVIRPPPTISDLPDECMLDLLQFVVHAGSPPICRQENGQLFAIG